MQWFKFNNVYETPFVKPCINDTKKLSFILENLIEEFKNSDTAQYNMLQTYLKQFIILSVRINKENQPIKTDAEHHIKNAYVTKVVGTNTKQSSKEVTLAKGEYVYFCPLNPTPQYKLIVR